MKAQNLEFIKLHDNATSILEVVRWCDGLTHEHLHGITISTEHGDQYVSTGNYVVCLNDKLIAITHFEIGEVVSKDPELFCDFKAYDFDDNEYSGLGLVIDGKIEKIEEMQLCKPPTQNEN